MAQRYHMDADFPGWPRRPTLEAAAALYFLACVGRVALNLAGYLVALAFPGLDGQGVNWGLNLLYQAGFLLLPVARYCQERPGMGTGLRPGQENFQGQHWMQDAARFLAELGF